MERKRKGERGNEKEERRIKIERRKEDLKKEKRE